MSNNNGKEGNNEESEEEKKKREEEEKKKKEERKTKRWTNILGGYIFIIVPILVYLVFILWPNMDALKSDKEVSKSGMAASKTEKVTSQPGTAASKTDVAVSQPGTADSKTDVAASKPDREAKPEQLNVLPNMETQIILLVLVIGALGSFVHAATSFVTYAGNRKLVTSWIWWYFLRPFIGSILALVFYFVIRGGFVSVGANADSLNLFGIAAVSGLVGMFSKQATDKLEEIFENFFKTAKGKGDDIRKDKLDDNVLACEHMIPMEKIVHFTIPKDKTEKDVKIKELYDMFKGPVTRLLVIDSDGKIKYLIHRGELSKYIADKCYNIPEGKPIADIQQFTLEEFISTLDKEQGIRPLVFISKKATLGEAKAKMAKTKNCRDIFITENGESNEPVIGWLTDVELNKNNQVE